MFKDSTLNLKHLLIEKVEAFRVNIRRKQIDQDFLIKRNKFSKISTSPSPNISFLLEFHQSFSQVPEATLQENLIKLRESFTTEQAIIPFADLSRTGIMEDLCNLIPRFPDNFRIISDIFWIIGQLCSGEPSYTSYFVSLPNEILKKSMEFLNKYNENDEVLVMIFFTLGNIIGTDPSLRKLLLKNEVLSIIFDIFKAKRSVTLVQETTWFLSVFLNSKPFLSQKKVQNIYPVLAYTLFLEEPHIISNTLWALTPFFSSCDSTFLVTSMFILDKIISLLKTAHFEENLNILVPAVQIIGNLLSGEDKIAKFLLTKGILDVLSPIFEVKCVKSQVCWCFGNLLSCKLDEVLSRIAHHKIINQVFQTAIVGQNNEKREILYGLIESFKNMRLDLVRNLMIKHGLCDVLAESLKNDDKKIRLLGLKGVYRLGKRGQDVYRDDGMNEMIARMENEFQLGDLVERIYEKEEEGDIHRLAMKILEKFYIF